MGTRHQMGLSHELNDVLQNSRSLPVIICDLYNLISLTGMKSLIFMRSSHIQHLLCGLANLSVYF